MKKFIISTIFICNLLLINYNLIAQEWVKNDVTKYFDKYTINDVKYYNDTYWILTHGGLIKYKDTKFYKYDLSEYSFGNIEKYLTELTYLKYIFRYIFISKNTLWLVDQDIKHILQIDNGEITNISIENDRTHFIYSRFLNFDNESKLWFVAFRIFDKRKKEEQADSLYYLDGNRFKNFNIYEKFDIKNISYFFIKDSTKYIISKQNNELTLSIIEGDQLVYKKFLDISLDFISFEHYIDSSKIYLLSDDNRLYIIDNEYNIERDYIKISRIGFFPLYSFLVMDEKLYLTREGLTIYDLITDISEITKPDDFEKNCMSCFDKIIKINNNEIWLLYGGGIIEDRCKNWKAGLAIYKIK